MNRDLLDRLEWMVSDIEVDSATVADVDAVVLNYIAAGIQLDSEASVMIARIDNRIVAQVMYKTDSDFMSIAGLWVSPSYRNTRAALALVCELLHAATYHNIHHIYFDVDEQHSALYLRLGARKIRGGYEVTL